MHRAHTLLSATAAFLLLASAATAGVPRWESNLGSELTTLTGYDDAAEQATLSFMFPYAGGSYDTIHVGTNGALALGGEGWASTYPSGTEFQSTVDPMIAPFWSDMNLESIGQVKLNDFGDRAVITWDRIGSYQSPGSPFTFQAQLLSSGEIVFGYKGIPGVSSGVLDEDAHVGLTEGNLPAMPPEVDYTAAPLSCGHTVLELFEIDSVFDLDYSNVVFTPEVDGYSITRLQGAPPPPPVRWETKLGSELEDLTACDDCAQQVDLSFSFPYAGSTYDVIHVGTNGAVALGGLGEADDYPSGTEFQTTADPMIAPFWSDMDLDEMGQVMLQDFGDRAVITWDGIGSYEAETTAFTFQLQLTDDGSILFSYNGIPGVSSSVIDEDVHVGLTEGNLAEFPAEIDYSDAPFASPDTILEIFELDSIFDLDGRTVLFTPQAKAGGYLVRVLDLMSGDCNRDGCVDIADLGQVASYYGESGVGWAQGDFNDDGCVDIADLGGLATNYGTGVCDGSGACPVPEPATLALLAIGALATLRRRRM